MNTTIFTMQTTGLVREDAPLNHASQPRMISMAAVLVDSKLEVRATCEVLMRPEGTISNVDAFRAHGITERELQLFGVRRHVALAALMDMTRASSEVIAFNMPFFGRMVQIELAQHGADPRDWERGGLKKTCMLQLSSQRANNGRPWTLKAACEYITRLPCDPPHDYRKAAYDVLSMRAMLQRMRNG